MNGIILFLAAGLGIQHGWTQTDDGSVEYIVQVDEASLDALRDGLPLVAAVPSELDRVDRIRIQIGEGPVPRTKIVNNKPPVVRANFDETSTTDLSNAAEQFARSIKEIPATLKTDAIDSLANSTDELADHVSETARSVLSRAADEIPMLAQNQLSGRTDNGWLPQGGSSSSAATGTTAQPTNVQQPRVRPISGQQNLSQFGGQKSVTGSTMNSTSTRQSSFAQPTGYNQTGYTQNGYTQTADANNVDQGKAATSDNNTNFNGQQNPNDTRQIGQYQPNQTQTQPGYPNREQGQQPNQALNQQPANNSSLDTRNGQTTIQRQAPDYQSAFSADSGGSRNNNFDLYAEQNSGNNLEPVRRPSSGVQAGNGTNYNTQPNSQFNSGNLRLNNQQTLTQGQQQANPNQNLQPSNGTNPQLPWPYWGTNGQVNTTPANPFQFAFNPVTGLPMNGLQSPNPYAPHGVWGMQSLSPPGGYNPYSTSRGNEKAADRELEKRDKRIEELVNAVEKLQKDDDKITPASNELGSNLPKTEPVKPSTQWATLLIFLFGSIGANFYLAWIALSFYHRYRTLSEDMRDSLNERIDSR